MQSKRLKIRTPNVTHRTIDGEVIIIDLDTGTYYSLAGVAGQIWRLVEAHGSVDAVVAACLDRYSGRPGEVEAGVQAFMKELEQEGLLVPLNGEPADVRVEPSDTKPPSQPSPYVEPVLDKFTDMQDLLLLDPIHEVDEAGWPHAPKTP